MKQKYTEKQKYTHTKPIHNREQLFSDTTYITFKLLSRLNMENVMSVSVKLNLFQHICCFLENN